MSTTPTTHEFHIAVARVCEIDCENGALQSTFVTEETSEFSTEVLKGLAHNGDIDAMTDEAVDVLATCIVLLYFLGHDVSNEIVEDRYSDCTTADLGHIYVQLTPKPQNISYSFLYAALDANALVKELCKAQRDKSNDDLIKKQATKTTARILHLLRTRGLYNHEIVEAIYAKYTRAIERFEINGEK